MLTPGDIAPIIYLLDQDGYTFDWRTVRGRRTVEYFCPKASTPGCAQHAYELRDVIGDTRITGVSPDEPAAQMKFADTKNSSNPVPADVDNALAGAYGVWTAKPNYERACNGIENSAFVIGPERLGERARCPISATDTVLEPLAVSAS